MCTSDGRMNKVDREWYNNFDHELKKKFAEKKLRQGVTALPRMGQIVVVKRPTNSKHTEILKLFKHDPYYGRGIVGYYNPAEYKGKRNYD